MRQEFEKYFKDFYWNAQNEEQLVNLNLNLDFDLPEDYIEIMSEHDGGEGESYGNEHIYGLLNGLLCFIWIKVGEIYTLRSFTPAVETSSDPDSIIEWFGKTIFHVHCYNISNLILWKIKFLNLKKSIGKRWKLVILIL
jgi:hypothetical protein